MHYLMQTDETMDISMALWEWKYHGPYFIRLEYPHGREVM